MNYEQDQVLQSVKLFGAILTFLATAALIYKLVQYVFGSLLELNSVTINNEIFAIRRLCKSFKFNLNIPMVFDLFDIVIL